MALLTDLYGEKCRYASALSKRGTLRFSLEHQRDEEKMILNKTIINY